MPAGLQCWDANGKLVVDIGDYNTRYLGRTNGTIAANANQLQIPYSGATLNGSFAVIVAAKSNSSGAPNADPWEFSARTVNNGILIIRIGAAKSVTLTVDVYAFI